MFLLSPRPHRQHKPVEILKECKLSKRKRKGRSTMMNPTSCVAGRSDAETEPRLSFVNLHRWPEAEAEFLKSLSHEPTNDNNERPSSSLHEPYASRQRYIRSYPFCCKEPFLRRTKKRMKIEMKKVRALSFSCLNGAFEFITSMRCSRASKEKEEEPFFISM